MEEVKVSGSTHKGTQPQRRGGGWITVPFIIASSSLLTIGNAGWVSNLIVYLIEKFQVKRIEAAQVYSTVNGCTGLFPILGAIMADSFLGCFSVVWISSSVAFLGTVLMTLTATIPSLKPQPCEPKSTTCPAPSRAEFAVLYAGIALASLGLGGMRFTLTTMGANQLQKAKARGTFFNCYFFSTYASGIVAATALVYVEDNVGWTWGFILCLAANGLGLAIFLLGSRFYCLVKPQGSPFTSLARVFVASFRKRKLLLSEKSGDYLWSQVEVPKVGAEAPTQSFRILNRAALITEGEVGPDGSIKKPWKLCTVQQVEDLKALLKILPLWSTSIFLGTPIGVLMSLLVVQALTMDRHLGPHFQIPAGSMLVFDAAFLCIGIALLDRLITPTWRKLTGRSATLLQLIGVSHMLIALSMAVAALVELKRRNVAWSHHLQDKPGSEVPMSVLWLVPQLAVVGFGGAIQLPAQVELYYREFPNSLKSLSTAMIGLLMGISFYLSTAIISCVKRVTGWLPDNINRGKVDNVFWMLVVIGVLNFGYYLECAKSY
ncbi:Nitrate-transporting ATPase [Bertholletia excelsa]